MISISRGLLATALAMGAVTSLGCNEVVRTPKAAHNTFAHQVTNHLAEVRACYDKSPAAQTHEKKIATVSVTLGDVMHVVAKADQASDPSLTSCIVSVLDNAQTPIKRGDMDWGGLAYGDWTFVYDPTVSSVTATNN